MSSRIPFRRRGPRALPRERKKDAGKEAAGVLPQAGQGRARRHTERPGQGQVVQADGPRPGPLALDGGRRGGPQPHRVQGARQGREGPDAPEDACPKLLSWPRCCNGCRNLRYRSCSRRWRCEYSAARAQALADAELRESRIGVDRGEAEFERIMGLIRYDVARGLSPQQIALGRAGQIGCM